jgi:soluble lytic murein transglycosylase
MRTFPILVLAALVLTGCNLNANALPTPNNSNVIYVTATVPLPTPNAEGIIVITATPDPNQVLVQQPVNNAQDTVIQPEAPILPTEIPTLAYAPEEELAAARQKYTNGYYEEAVAMYQALLGHGETVPPDIRAEAAYRLAQAALREGLFNDAVSALTQLITNFPQNQYAVGAYFLRGDAYLGLSQWQAAIDDYGQ